MKHRQSGFTLVEIAIVLVIIGLLLGGILRGQELINSARVRNLADMATGTQAAFFGFSDRYRSVPGDMTAEDAQDAIGGAFNGNPQANANQNGRLDPASYAGNAIWTEPNAAWEQLSRAGFIQGDFGGNPATEPTAANDLAPTNPFNNPMLLGITLDYFDNANPAPARMQLVMGRGIDVRLIRELDVKMDDGMPRTGIVRAAPNGNPALFTGNNNWGGSDLNINCVNILVNPNIYNAAGQSLDCNAVLIF